MVTFIVSTAKKGKGKRLYIQHFDGSRFSWTGKLSRAAWFSEFDVARDYAKKAYKAHVLLITPDGEVFHIESKPLMEVNHGIH